jgi:hypothetical protein
MELPFKIPHVPGRVPDVIELEPDTAPVLEGHEVIASTFVGEPWHPPTGVPGTDVVTVTVRQKVERGRFVPQLYEVTYWRRVPDGR